MRKTLRRLIALVLVLAMSMSLTLTAWATDAGGTEEITAETVAEETTETTEDTLDVDLSVTYGQTSARTILDMVNEFRTGDDAWYWNEDDTTKTTCSNLSELTYDYDLESVAMQRAAEIAIYYSHTRPDGSDAFSAYGSYVYTSAGENIAVGYTTAAGVFTGWQETDESYSGQGHRRNMLDSGFTKIGIGHVYFNGTHYWVMELAKSSNSSDETVADDNEETVAVTISADYITGSSVTVSPSSYSLAVGASAGLPVITVTLQLNSTWPASEVPVSVPYDWTSSDDTVAAISGDQIVAEAAGTAELTADVLDETVSVPVTVTETIETVASGTCGSNLTWVLDSSGTLTISGTGAMTNYTTSGIDSHPWYNDYRELISAVVIEDGVTTVGNLAFADCTKLSSIKLPESLTSIGNYAFSGCSSLKSIELPDSLVSIGSYAFYYCKGLKSIEIPANVSSISLYAFEYCTALTGVTISGEITTIGSYTFAHCTKLSSVSLPETLTSISDSAFYACTSLSAITLPESLTSIGRSAFESSGLKTIVIPDSVTNIEASAFEGCSSLTSVTLGSGVESIGSGAFYVCSGLSAITVSSDNQNFTVEDGILYDKDVTTLILCPAAGFRGSLDVPDSVTSISSYAFAFCTKLTAISFPDGLTSIGSYAFRACTGLTSIVIPYGVTVINTCSFLGCTGLTEVDIPDSVVSINYGAFCYCSSLENIDIPESVTTIDVYAFYESEALKEVTILPTVTSIGQYALGYTISTATLGVVKISGFTINGYTGSAAETYAEDNGFTFVSIGELKDISGCSVTLSSTSYTYDRTAKKPVVTVKDDSVTLTEGKDYTVSYSDNINAGTATVTVTGIGYYTGTATATFVINQASQTVTATISASDISEGGTAQISASATGNGTLSYVSDNTSVATVSSSGLVTGISAGTATITVTAAETANYTAASATLIVTVVAPADISACTITLSETVYTYDGTAKKPGVTVKDGSNTLTEGTDYSVAYSDNVDVGTATVTVTGMGLYTGTLTASFMILASDTVEDSGTCGDNLTWEYYEGGVLVISGSGAMTDWDDYEDTPWYSHASSVTKLIIGDGVTTIGQYAFGNFTSLTNVTISDSVVIIGGRAFFNCASLTNVTIPDSVTCILNNAFFMCTNLSSITIPSSVVRLDYTSGLYTWDATTGRLVTDECDKICGYTYSAAYWLAQQYNIEFESLGTLTEEDENYIGSAKVASGEHGDHIYWALYGDGALFFCGVGEMDDTDVGNTSSAELLYTYHSDIKKVYFTEGIASIGSRTLASGRAAGHSDTTFEELTEIYIADSITTIGSYAFYECPALTTVKIGSGVTSLGDYVFSYDTQLSTITVSEDNSCFKTVDGVLYSKDGTTLYLFPKTEGGDYTIPDGTETIVLDAFGDCTELASVTIPVSVTKIERYAFDGCTSLTDIYYEGSKSQWEAISNSANLSGVTIHYAVEDDSGSGDSGDTGSGDSGSGDTGDSGSGDSGDTGSGDTGSGDSGDTGSGDTGSGDSGDTGSGDTGSGDSGDTGSGDTGSGDSGDTGSGDTGSGDSGDTGAGDTGSGDSGDTGSGDTGSGDSGDTGSGDAGSGDTGSGDSGDTGSGDSGSSDTDSGDSGSGDSHDSDSTGDTLMVRRGTKFYFNYTLKGGDADFFITAGEASDQVLVGDWDGDGIDGICLRRGNICYFINDITTMAIDLTVTYGRETDEVLVGDWDGDGRDSLAMRRNGNVYYFCNDIENPDADTWRSTYGRADDEVLVGDWEGNGYDSLAARRNGNIYYISLAMVTEPDGDIWRTTFGRVADEVLVGDWDGNGTDSLAMRRNGNVYYISNSISDPDAGVDRFTFGRTTDEVYAGKWQ